MLSHMGEVLFVGSFNTYIVIHTLIITISNFFLLRVLLFEVFYLFMTFVVF